MSFEGPRLFIQLTPGGRAVPIATVIDRHCLVACWLGECCDTGDPAYREPARPLYERFKDWCVSSLHLGDDVLTETAFGRALSAMGFPARKCCWTGNRLRAGLRIRRVRR